MNATEDVFTEGEAYCREGERLEARGEIPLSLAFFTNAASKFKVLATQNGLSSDVQLRAQIRREACLKKARTMYRRLLVQSAQKTPNAPQPQQHSRSKKSQQVSTEKRSCNTCNKSCFWLKEGLCSDCDLRVNDQHRRNTHKPRSHSSRDSAYTTPRDPYTAPLYTAPLYATPRAVPRAVPRAAPRDFAQTRDFTKPRNTTQQPTFRRRQYQNSASDTGSSSEEEYTNVKSCAICCTYRMNNPRQHYRSNCC